MNDSFPNRSIDPELEARIVDMVLGEASEVERERLQEMIDQDSALQAFKQQMVSIHGLLSEAGNGELSADGEQADWKLSSEKRTALLALFANENDASLEDDEKIAAPDADKLRPNLDPHNPAAWRFTKLGMALASIAAIGLMIVVLPNLILSRREGLSNIGTNRFIGREVQSTADSAVDFDAATEPLPSSLYSINEGVDLRSGTALSWGKIASSEFSSGVEPSISTATSDVNSSGNGPAQTVPSPYYLSDEVEYFPGRGEFKLAEEAKKLRAEEEVLGQQLQAQTRGLNGTTSSVESNEELFEDFAPTDKESMLAGGYALPSDTREIQPEEAAAQNFGMYGGSGIGLGGMGGMGMGGGMPGSVGGRAGQSRGPRRPQVAIVAESERRASDLAETAKPDSVMLGVTPRIVINEEEENPVDNMLMLDRSGIAPGVRSDMTPDVRTWNDLSLERKAGDVKGRQLKEFNEYYWMYDPKGKDALKREAPTPAKNQDFDSDRLTFSLDVEDLDRKPNGQVGLSDNSASDAKFKNMVDGYRLQFGRTSEGEVRYQRGKAKLRRSEVPSSLEEISASTDPFSTFSLHVSDVSFKLAQAALAQGEWPDKSKIRIEEFVNAFDYGDPLPASNEAVACTVEQTIHPFLQQRNLLRVSMRTAAAGRAASTPLRLTFLLDTSGSMERVDRRQLVKAAMAMLVQQLKPYDQVTLISFARQTRLWADKVSGDQADQLLGIIDEMPSEGGTNIEGALRLAFEKAMEQRIEGAQNRVVMLTDGAVNLGDANPERLSQIVESMRVAGIAFDAAGISAQGLNDEVLEALTRKGDGRYYLLDSLQDADDKFAKQIAGALRPSAKNVKVQVEFNPERVGQYKLLGFEKHRLNTEDFRNDAVDAAEMAAAEAGVAVYQFEAKPDGEGDVGSVSVRFQDLSSGQMVEHRWPIPYEPETMNAASSPVSMQVATVAALFAAKLRGEPLGEFVDLATLSELMNNVPQREAKKPRVEALKAMIQQARAISGE